MKNKHLIRKFFSLLIPLYIFWSCDFKTREKYILPNQYRGFFGVIYQDNTTKEMNKVGGYRIYNVSNNGVCESGFRISKGPVVQEFYFKNGIPIESFGFQMISYIKDFEIEKLKNNKSKIFALYISGVFVDDRENSVGIFLIDTGENILKILPNTSEIVLYIRHFEIYSSNRNNTFKNYIKRLNENYLQHRTPFN